MNAPEVMPGGCKCDPETWHGFPVTPVCNAYADDERWPGHCANCEHDEECHQISTVAKATS